MCINLVEVSKYLQRCTCFDENMHAVQKKLSLLIEATVQRSTRTSQKLGDLNI